jgi:hypothetical protein
MVLLRHRRKGPKGQGRIGLFVETINVSLKRFRTTQEGRIELGGKANGSAIALIVFASLAV